MTGLAIVSFLLGAVSLFFAVKPKLAFYLDEGWKFKDTPAPSDAYLGVNLIGCLAGAAVFIVMGVVLLSQRSTFAAEDAAFAAADRCREELLPRFDDTVEWAGTRLANPDEVRRLASELGVEVTVADDVDLAEGRPRGDLVRILDPHRPGADKLAFRYLGAFHDQYWAGPNSCESYTSGLES
ncbi:hypothetical protein CIW49_26835 [Mycolicibacterium sp. P1-18]|uniref:DUF6199 family natural product biosynthesis protein n=1 Tax=Mycolicibacterium sp. P1-18 TaxID=2024615 RepID=UPI0011F2F585|nr:DUF6199 family natural product biosynthesis protein [Mycolicibacterium sp. P1-18]KAA0093666.1 hypothetical protein CIW49_26835 [Mycolicibacterium sp. P1-18]